ncbi:MAG: hypothetical protein IKA36_02655 [Clostridia bacterium]|nr:hypothetical protein [Clostridia bacterium]
MKIFCVSGGNYKSFYLNAFLKVKNYDLLVINFGIMYDIQDVSEESGVVLNELKMLNAKAKVPIIAGVRVGEKRVKKLVLCSNGKCEVCPINQGVKIKIKDKEFVVGTQFTNFRNFNKIVLSENRIDINHLCCSYRKIYIFCDDFGITKIEKRKISRKFYKYAKIILK